MEGSEHMSKNNDLHEVVQNLMLLDPQSLLLIKSGIELLLARQNMKLKNETKGSEQKANQIVG